MGKRRSHNLNQRRHPRPKRLGSQQRRQPNLLVHRGSFRRSLRLLQRPQHQWPRELLPLITTQDPYRQRPPLREPAHRRDGQLHHHVADPSGLEPDGIRAG
jgi:hypothetical protein